MLATDALFAQGQFKNIPFSDILNTNLHQWKKTGKTYLLPFNFRWLRPKQNASSVLIFKYDCHIGKMK